jgi:hypothetical protein
MTRKGGGAALRSTGRVFNVSPCAFISPPPPHPPSRKHHSRSSHRHSSRRCFRCLAHDHLVKDCRDPVHCAGCRRSGHRHRDCSQRKPSGATPPHYCTPSLSVSRSPSTSSRAHRDMSRGGRDRAGHGDGHGDRDIHGRASHRSRSVGRARSRTRDVRSHSRHTSRCGDQVLTRHHRRDDASDGDSFGGHGDRHGQRRGASRPSSARSHNRDHQSNRDRSRRH